MKKQKSKRQAAAQPATITPAPLIGALKVPATCAYLGGMHKNTLYRLVQRGLIRPSRGTRHLLFSVAELNRYLRDSQGE